MFHFMCSIIEIDVETHFVEHSNGVQRSQVHAYHLSCSLFYVKDRKK